MSLAIVQHHAEIKGSNVPGSSNQITLGSALTPGNLLIAFIGCNLSTSSITTNGAAGWFVIQQTFQNNSDQGSTAGMILGRYVQSGDSNTAIPAVWTAGGTWWGYSIYEISGVTGNRDNDIQITWGQRQGDVAMPPLPALHDGLALCFFGSYDGGSDAAPGGSWTVDDAIHNSGNYGSITGASRNMTAGDLIDGTWTGFSAAPNSGCGLILGTVAPGKMAFRNFGGFGGHNFAYPIQLPGDPTPGNLLVAWTINGRGDGQSPIFDPQWTQAGSSPQGSVGDYMSMVYRYVQSGDTRSMAFVNSGASFFFDGCVAEFSGVAGAWAYDFQENTYFAGLHSNARNPETTTPTITNTANQLAVLWVGVYDSSGPLDAISSGWLQMGRVFDAPNAGWFQLSYQYVPAASTSVTAVISYATNDTGGYMQMLFGSGTGASSGGGGGGVFAVNRLFPEGLTKRNFPLDTGRVFPLW